MNTAPNPTPVRETTRSGLAIVGFIALIIFGIAFGVYAARFIPSIADRIGAAAVYLGTVFTSDDTDGGLTVVPSPTASTTLSFGTTTPSTSPAATTTTVTPDTKPVKPAPKPVASRPVAPAPAPLFGLPDLTVDIIATGYVTTNSIDSFRESSSVPSGENPAIKFVVRNTGTNISGVWNMRVNIPTRTASVKTFDDLESMPPKQEITYIVYFTEARRGSDQEITVTVNYDDSVNESNTNNNSDTADIDIR